MSPERRGLITKVGVELGAVLASARAVTNDAAAAFVEDCPALRPAAFHVARWLHSFGAARPTEIAAALGMDKAALSRLVADLVGAGFVEKRPHPDDARSIAVTLTRSGTQSVARALKTKGAALIERLATFDDDELATLAGLLNRLRGGTVASVPR
jgi:DNA-binding MarR family transcriptional regulator